MQSEQEENKIMLKSLDLKTVVHSCCQSLLSNRFLFSLLFMRNTLNSVNHTRGGAVYQNGVIITVVMYAMSYSVIVFKLK